MGQIIPFCDTICLNCGLFEGHIGYIIGTKNVPKGLPDTEKTTDQ